MKIKISLFKNFDDIDDFMEEEVELDKVGEYLYNKEKEYWFLDESAYEYSTLLQILALKQNYQFEKVINTLNELVYELSSKV